MKVIAMDRHDGEGEFPTFRAGEIVHNLELCDEYAHWLSCMINGIETFIPDIFVENSILARDHNPTELVVKKDEILEIEGIVYEWLYGKNEAGNYGWVPAEKVVSMTSK